MGSGKLWFFAEAAQLVIIAFAELFVGGLRQIRRQFCAGSAGSALGQRIMNFLGRGQDLAPVLLPGCLDTRDQVEHPIIVKA